MMMPDAVLGGYADLLEPNEVPGFRTVTGMHYGLYLGGVLGLVKAVRRGRCGARSDVD